MWTYELHLRFAYTVGAQHYIGTRASFSTWAPNENFNPLNQLVASRFPAGKHVMAHYDPQNHSRSILEPRPAASAWIALVLGMLFALFGLTYFYRAGNDKKALACGDALPQVQV
jgi:hypothetical protein